MSLFTFFLRFSRGSFDYAERVSGDLAVGMTAASYLRRSRLESRVETFIVEILMEEFSVTLEGRIITYIIVESRNDATLKLVRK
jgi:hypothetical protein